MATKRRPKGEGSIRKLKSGKLSMTITIGKKTDGTQVRKSVSAWTRQELLDEAAKLRMKYNVLSPDQKEAMLHKLTFEEFAKEILALQELELAYNTLANYRNIDNAYLIPVLGHYPLNEITPSMCDTLLKNLLLDEDLAAPTIHQIKSRLNSLFNKAVKQDKLIINPLTKSNVKIPTKKNKASTFVLPSEKRIKEMLGYIKKHRAYLYPLVLTAITTGMRRGELIGLKWDALNFQRNTLQVKNQISTEGIDADLKTSSSYRTIHVSKKVMKVLKGLPKYSDYVFVTPRSHRHYTANISATLGTIFKKINMPENFTMHDLRHFHATQLLKHNINIKVVSRRLGHANVYITLDLYFNYMPEMDAEASVVLDDMLI